MHFLATAYILSGLLQISLGCSCLYNPLIPYWKSQMCQGVLNYGFLIEAKVTGLRTEVEPTDPYTDYSYEISTPYNYAKELGDGVDATKIYTGHDSGLCGIDGIETGVKYVMSGYISNGKMRVGSCNFLVKWTILTAEQMEFLKNPKSRDCQNGGFACSCELDPSVRNSQICTATNADDGFVIIAKVTGKSDTSAEPFYTIKLQGSTVPPGVDDTRVYTSSGICGIILLQGNTYILSGHTADGKMIVDACDFVKLWTDATNEEKQAVKNPDLFCPMLPK